MFIRLPAPPKPALEKNVTNGLTWFRYAVCGRSSASRTVDPM